MPEDPKTESHIVTALALVICREVYTLAAGAVGIWQTVCEVQDRLMITPAEAQEALQYAIGKGWLDGFGTPLVRVTLQKPGSALFDGSKALPKEPRT